jgi:hypothetical protein
MRGGFRNKRRGGLPIRLIGAGVVVLLLIAALFWFAGQAESNRPVQHEIRVEATNVGPE